MKLSVLSAVVYNRKKPGLFLSKALDPLPDIHRMISVSNNLLMSVLQNCNTQLHTCKNTARNRRKEKINANNWQSKGDCERTDEVKNRRRDYNNRMSAIGYKR